MKHPHLFLSEPQHALLLDQVLEGPKYAHWFSGAVDGLRPEVQPLKKMEMLWMVLDSVARTPHVFVYATTTTESLSLLADDSRIKFLWPYPFLSECQVCDAAVDHQLGAFEQYDQLIAAQLNGGQYLLVAVVCRLFDLSGNFCAGFTAEPPHSRRH